MNPSATLLFLLSAITLAQLLETALSFQIGKFGANLCHAYRNVRQNQPTLCYKCPREFSFPIDKDGAAKTGSNMKVEEPSEATKHANGFWNQALRAIHETTDQQCQPWTARNARIQFPLQCFVASLGASTFILDPVLAAPSLSTMKEVSLFQRSMNLNFPRSWTNSQIVSRLLPMLSRRGYRPTNTLLATSLCSDELNSSEKSLEARLRQRFVPAKYGGVFHLGGLGGIPFVGLSGFKAMLGHVPNNGKVVLVFGPHVGIDEMGIVGNVQRNGQDHKPTSCCGAVVAASQALKRKKSNTIGYKKKKDSALMDEEEEFIISYLTRLNSASSPTKAILQIPMEVTLATLTQAMYDLVRDQVLSLVQACIDENPSTFWTNISELTLLGGIVINRSYTSNRKDDDYFQPLMLTTLTAQGNQDLYSETFKE